MSEQKLKRTSSNSYIIGFIVILSLVCALILSTLSSALKQSQEIARNLDRSEQMMIAAHVMDHEGYFIIRNEEGKDVRATFEKGGFLVPGTPDRPPERDQVIEVFEKRFRPRLTDDSGKVYTFAQANISEHDYIQNYRKGGYYKQRYKLFYEILPNQEQIDEDTTPVGYVIPVNGYGLWDAIYGYIALEPDGNTVIGISWYEQKETPGLGANIAESEWQSQFPGKHVFQESPDGKTDFETAPVGILVVRGRVSEALGDVPKAKSAVDGMSGATLTGNGVTKAYKDVLTAYRPFLVNVHEKTAEEKTG